MRLGSVITAAVLGGLASAVCLPACAQIFPLNPSGYRIIQAPAFSTGHPGSARSFQWIDSTRLLFLANDTELSSYEKREGRTVMVKEMPTIHFWDVRRGTIERYRNEPLADYLCAVDGRVWYGLYRGERRVVFEGLFGSESERTDSKPSDVSNASRLNRFACEQYSYGDLPRFHAGRPIPLRKEHGVLEREASDAGTGYKAIAWWNISASDSRRVPFPQEIVSDPLSFSFIAKGYLSREIRGRQETGMVNRLYLWLPDENSVRTFDVPGSGNWSALSHLILTHAGLLATSYLPAKRSSKRDPGPAGLYLFAGPPVEEFIAGPSANLHQKQRPLVVEQIVSGLIDAISDVSPDGCLIAAVVDPWNEERERPRLEAIDVCRTAPSTETTSGHGTR